MMLSNPIFQKKIVHTDAKRTTARSGYSPTRVTDRLLQSKLSLVQRRYMTTEKELFSIAYTLLAACIYLM